MKMRETCTRILKLPKSPRDTWAIAGGRCDFLEDWLGTGNLGANWEPWTEKSVRHGYNVQVLSDRLLIEIELPGITPDEIRLEVRERQITVVAVKPSNFLNPPSPFCANFAHTFSLPFYTGNEAIEAEFEGGTLSLAIPFCPIDRNSIIPLNETSPGFHPEVSKESIH